MNRTLASEKVNNISCGYAIIEYLLREAMKTMRTEPDRVVWDAGVYMDRLHQLTVWVEDRMAIEFFLEDELVHCFTIPEYYRSIEQKIRLLAQEVRDSRLTGFDDPVSEEGDCRPGRGLPFSIGETQYV